MKTDVDTKVWSSFICNSQRLENSSDVPQPQTFATVKWEVLTPTPYMGLRNIGLREKAGLEAHTQHPICVTFQVTKL